MLAVLVENIETAQTTTGFVHQTILTLKYSQDEEMEKVTFPQAPTQGGGTYNDMDQAIRAIPLNKVEASRGH